jgi:hypothetical protein
MDRILAAGSGCALLGGVASIHEGVREWLVDVLTGNPSTELSIASARLQGFALPFTESLSYFGTEHLSLTIFAIISVVFVVLMLRT